MHWPSHAACLHVSHANGEYVCASVCDLSVWQSVLCERQPICRRVPHLMGFRCLNPVVQLPIWCVFRWCDSTICSTLTTMTVLRLSASSTSSQSSETNTPMSWSVSFSRRCSFFYCFLFSLALFRNKSKTSSFGQRQWIDKWSGCERNSATKQMML